MKKHRKYLKDLMKIMIQKYQLTDTRIKANNK